MQQYNKVRLLEYLQSVARETTNTKKGRYYELICSFDIETTSTIVNGEKFAFMYEWTFGIEDYIFYGRNWGEFLQAMEDIQGELNTSDDLRLLVYVHNLSFEFQFIKDLFTWVNVFALDERKPIKALCDKGFEFRCSYVLSGLNLVLTAKNLTSTKIEKLVGELDYKLIRHELTPLSSKELKYCEYDVKIVIAYIREQKAEYKSLTKLPLTNTGRVRSYVRANCLYSNSNHHKTSRGKYFRYRKLMNELTLTSDQYKQLKQVFQGGFTHANYLQVGKILHDVHSIDFTSSYPAVMLSELFPMGKPKRFEGNQRELLQRFNYTHYGYMFIAYFTNIQATFHEQYISEHKCIKLSKAAVNNGRVFSAETLAIACTDIDYKILEKVYSWENVRFSNVWEFYLDYLPRAIITSIIQLYKDKTTLKGVAGQENEYLKAKGMLNSVYGMCVTDIVKDESTYNTSWVTLPADIDEVIEQYNDSKNRFLYYPWGVWVTAYARKNLWNGILNIGEDYIYSDTDSIKFLNYEKHLPYIQWYNQRITEKIKTMCEFYKIPYDDCQPKTIKGKLKPLGVWDYEGVYTSFKTLGAKRYMYIQDNELHITIAGLSKKQGVKYLLDKYGTNEKVLENFSDELYIPAEGTGKNTHTYIDDFAEYDIIDYRGVKNHIQSNSGVHLEECEFTLSLSRQYATFLKNFVTGYTSQGTKYI